MKREYYSASIEVFLETPLEEILGELSSQSEFNIDLTQRDAWITEINILKTTLKNYGGWISFEYSIPRMGKRIDVLILIGHVVFIIEFKVGSDSFTRDAIEQVWDYALDLKNFHETSHELHIAPILVATNAEGEPVQSNYQQHEDRVMAPIKSSASQIERIISEVLARTQGHSIAQDSWAEGRYSPTPTIIEAARALYNNHSVIDISRSDATAINLTKTTKTVEEVVANARNQNRKAICFVTGVPGAGKTLVGLDIASKTLKKGADHSSVFLSGNGPLVSILREALTRDKVKRDKKLGKKSTKGSVMSEVKLFIQNVHHFRDESIRDGERAPFEHVAIFDEAQRAWNLEKTSSFMKTKKGIPSFKVSESEFLISCLDRHKDWAVVVCLVGGGQEIHTGEAGIGEWISSINRSFPHWQVFISPKLTDSEYESGQALNELKNREGIFFKEDLHLAVSMRSFRAEHLSIMVKSLLDMDIKSAQASHNSIRRKYPVVITRDLSRAKLWLKDMARGSERYGMVVSSQALRLKPHAIDVKSPMDPVHWFLDEKDDVRSSYFLEDVATEFHVQGLELDWTCVTWDADFRYSQKEWKTYSFSGNRWKNISKPIRKQYLKNAYRVLLTRARQGMVIVVPEGDIEDHTRLPSFYDDTFHYLKNVGFPEI